jgi:hypothetical protein
MTKDEALKRNPTGIADKAAAGIGGVSLPNFRSHSDCPKNVRVPMGGDVSITVPTGCVATVDVRGLPIEDRGIASDPDRSQPAADGKETSDFATVSYIYENGEMVGSSFTPNDGYKRAGLKEMTFRVFSRKMLTQ